MSTTHEVTNQPPLLADYDVFRSDPALVEALGREGASWAEGELAELGARAGTADVRHWGELADRYPPVLRTHDRYGHRVDEVEFHPAYHRLMATSVGAGLHSRPWGEGRRGAHVARAAKMIVWGQVDQGHLCPVSMTYAVLPALRHQPDVAARWEPGILADRYDPRLLPPEEKDGLLCGMAMTEKQGGSDVRANTTRAEPVAGGGPGGEYVLTGHKWFCSAPQSDAFLVLAQASGGLSCFLLPRWRPDGSRNAIRIQRLKDKLGNRSNASAEVELEAAWARMVGEEGRGVRTIIEMVNHTRLDCVLSSAALMRRAVSEAVHHAAHRRAFGKLLLGQPLMRNVLGDLALETEAAIALAMRLARAYDGADDASERALARVATAVAKYWVCKRSPAVVGEALECLGGNGYVEESGMPRLFRESPLAGIWEGSGNVICLDVLRALEREPATADAFLAELRAGEGADRRLDALVRALESELTGPGPDPVGARRLVERMGIGLQASLLVRYAPAAVADAFCAGRLGERGAAAFGTLPVDVAPETLLERARPG